MRIAIFDYKIKPTNPIGGCHLKMLRALAADHQFTVFAVEFENPAPDRIRWVRIPAPVRPLALLFVTFHLLAPFYYLLERWRAGARFDLVQSVETNLLFGTVIYSQFCHTAYLRDRAPRTTFTAAGIFRWLDHRLHALLEPLRYRRARHVVTPSRGFAAELAREFPTLASKLRVVQNPVDVAAQRRPADFDREAARQALGFTEQDVVLVFAALGHFERKGLPLLLEAMARRPEPWLKLLVVGGEPGLVASYQQRADALGLFGRVQFVGVRRNIAPYFWASDVFAFPSLYETFSLVAFEAAAAGLPLLVSRLYGVEELLRPGDNGFEVETTVEGVERGLSRIAELPRAALAGMGRASEDRVEAYDTEEFIRKWTAFYASVGPASAPRSSPDSPPCRPPAPAPSASHDRQGFGAAVRR